MAGDTPKGPIMWEMWWSIGGAVQLFQPPAQQGLEGPAMPSKAEQGLEGPDKPFTRGYSRSTRPSTCKCCILIDLESPVFPNIFVVDVS